MRARRVVPTAAVVVLAGAAVAWAAHPEVDPATVPTGFFSAHNQMNSIPTSAVKKVLKPGKADAFLSHTRLEPGQSTPFLTHPGPVFVMVERGSVTNQEVSGEDCRTKSYLPDQGFVSRGGSGAAHRMTAGAQGAELYMFYLAKRKTGATDKPVGTPSACS